LKDVEVNLNAGIDSPLLHAEDVLRYGTFRIEPNEEKVIELFQRVANLKGVKSIGTSHIALATVYHRPKLVERVSEILMSLPKQKWIGTQTGIETGSVRLVAKYMAGKALPSPPEKWPEIVRQSIGILNDNHWVPACTLIVGLPGEKKEDVIKTLELLDDIKDSLSLIVPLNFVAMKGCALSAEESFTREKMTSEHWMLLGKCVEHDLRTVRKLLKDYTKEENLLMRWLFRYLINFMAKHAEKYAAIMKKGLPPRDYQKISKNYLVPQF
jgi:radical SAM superfamily enzyme YgiQ (UPF0313 family)